MNIKHIVKRNGISITLCSLIVGFSLCSFLLKDELNSIRENRPLQQSPELKMANVWSGEYQKNMESYLSDQFPLRSILVSMHANLEHELGKNEFKDILIGKNDMLFQKRVTPSKAMMNEKITALNSFVKEHSNLAISMILVPNKVSVYADILPSHVGDQNQLKDIQKLQKGLDEQIHFVDAYTPLAKYKEEELYYRSDHHWTSQGAYRVFEAWKQAMLPEEALLKYDTYTVNASFYGTLANTSGYYRGDADHVDIKVSSKDPSYYVQYANEKKSIASLFAMDKADTANPYEVFLSGNHPLIDISTTAENTKHLLILKDSYANSFVPYLLSYYSKITIVDPRYYYDDLQQLIKDRSITDVLFLYNANTFFSDTSLQSILNETT